MYHKVSVSFFGASILSLSILSVSSMTLDINFIPIQNYGNTTDNMKDKITNAILDGASKSLDDRGLCEHIVSAMENGGKAWNCLCNVGTFWINSDAGNDGAAYFTIGGVPWLVFKGEQLIKQEDLKKLEDEKKRLTSQLATEKANSNQALKAQKAAETERDVKKKELDECNVKIKKVEDVFAPSNGNNPVNGNAPSGGTNNNAPFGKNNPANGNAPSGGKNTNAPFGGKNTNALFGGKNAANGNAPSGGTNTNTSSD